MAIIGSRNVRDLDISKFIPKNTSLIVSGGAKGADTLAEEYADNHGIDKLIFLPEYERYGRAAPIVRNKLIVENAELIVAIWDGVSRGTGLAIDYAQKIGKKIKIFGCDKG